MEFVCFVWISEQTANFALQNIKRLVFITEVESVYSVIRTETLYNTDTFRLKRLNNLTKLQYICIQDRLEARVVRRDPKLPMILPKIKQMDFRI
jgi:hypothetical protein